MKGKIWYSVQLQTTPCHHDYYARVCRGNQAKLDCVTDILNLNGCKSKGSIGRHWNDWLKNTIFTLPRHDKDINTSKGNFEFGNVLKSKSITSGITKSKNCYFLIFYKLQPIDFIGRDERIWTSDPLHPMQVRYQAALRPDRNYENRRRIT